MIKIPVFQNVSADFKQEISLGDQLVQIRLIWNVRAESFFLYFTDQNGNPLNGIKVITNWPMLADHKGFLDFDGDLIVLKTDEDAGLYITYDNFGNVWDLYYLTQDEATAWRTANGL